jgi:hypothetical protein
MAPTNDQRQAFLTERLHFKDRHSAEKNPPLEPTSVKHRL